MLQIKREKKCISENSPIFGKLHICALSAINCGAVKTAVRKYRTTAPLPLCRQSYKSLVSLNQGGRGGDGRARHLSDRGGRASRLDGRSGLDKVTARRAGRPFGVGQSHRSARWSTVRDWAKSPLGALKTKAPPLPIRQRGREYLGGGATVAPARGSRGGRLRCASPGRWRGPGIDLHRGRVSL